MTFHTGLFVREQVTGDDIVGTSPVGARIALGGLIQDHGTLRGLPITGTTGWAYRVGAGAVALTRGSGDGSVLVGNDAPMDVPTTPAPGTGSRWDRIWVRQNDVDAGDEDNQVVVGVTQGTSGGSPTVPPLPAGATEIGRAQVTAGASDTNASGVSISTAQRPVARLAGTPETTTREVFTGPAALAPAGGSTIVSAELVRDTGPDGTATFTFRATIRGVSFAEGPLNQTIATIPTAHRPTTQGAAIGSNGGTTQTYQVLAGGGLRLAHSSHSRTTTDDLLVSGSWIRMPE
ncbi:hypothetical protein [Sanguibacter sp. Z1732]|uniref:hypothetical protein n=2 Tax=Micrococcales TaxID=85006 RepID=UPI003D9CACCB